MTAEVNRAGSLSMGNWLHVGGGVALLLILLLFGVLPAHRKGRILEQVVAQDQAKFAEHLALMPFWAELTALRSEMCAGADVQELVPLGREEFGTIHDMLQGQATAESLDVISVVPQVVTVASRRFLCAKIMVEGEFEKFPDFVRGMMAWPSFFCLDKLSIHQGDGEEQLEVVVWLAVKQQGGEGI